MRENLVSKTLPVMEDVKYRGQIITKGVVVAHLRAPAANQVDPVLCGSGHSGIPLANQIDILVYLVGFDFVENDGMDVFTAGEDLRIGAFDVLVELLALLGSVDERGQGATLGRLILQSFIP